MKTGSEDAYAIEISMGDLCLLDPELSLIVRPVSRIHFSALADEIIPCLAEFFCSLLL